MRNLPKFNRKISNIGDKKGRKNTFIIDSISFELRNNETFNKKLAVENVSEFKFEPKKDNKQKPPLKMEKTEKNICCNDDICIIY